MDIFISVDIEADGPIPGPYSMSSFGMYVAGCYSKTEDRFYSLDDMIILGFDPKDVSFYRELKPISVLFEPEAAAVSGLDRDDLITNGADPEQAMVEADLWVDRFDLRPDESTRAIFVAWPLSFDWLFMYWYFMNFNGHSPFGFSNAIDIKTTAWSKLGQPELKGVGKRGINKTLGITSPHTHNALDDAKEQAELFAKLWMWSPVVATP